ncbi:DUF4174 domain-containing protein [Lacinutrix sp.]|uniref:DUF4174 domain-containing protein n=1 Tax=Lacinutrix sp. TaxID=1937692 RepID=UPI0025C244B0|nr:DUF4174 domain-containing protein [Lacinutrix sp.]
MRLFIILITFLSLKTIAAQDLKKQQWKHRLLLVLSLDEDNKDYKTQLNYLENSVEDIEERQLVIYKILPNKHQSTLNKNEDNWTEGNQLYQKHMNSKSTFKVVLIGLDGSIKKTRKTPINTEVLFNIIDAMPMRQSEIRKK